MHRIVVDVQTGEIIQVPLSEEEIAQIEAAKTTEEALLAIEQESKIEKPIRINT